MNKKQLTDLVITPTLKEIPKGFSDQAVLAIQMIIAHESMRGEYLKQIKGPALGLINMEPATHNDTWKFGDSIWRNAVELKIITEHQRINKIHPVPARLIYDLRYNVFMARQRLFMFTEKLPGDIGDMAVYLKKYWNGGGKATVTKYHFDFKKWD